MMQLTPEDYDPFSRAFPDYPRNQDVEKWINIEEDTGIQEAIVDRKIILYQEVLDYGGFN